MQLAESKRFFAKQARHSDLDFEHVCVLRAHGSKTARQLEYIFWICTARPGRSGDIARDRSGGGWPEVVPIFGAGDVDDPGHAARMIRPREIRSREECDLDPDAVVASAFSMVEAEQYVLRIGRRNFVSGPPTPLRPERTRLIKGLVIIR